MYIQRRFGLWVNIKTASSLGPKELKTKQNHAAHNLVKKTMQLVGDNQM